MLSIGCAIVATRRGGDTARRARCFTMCNMRGTQTVGRAVSLLREVAARGSFGWRLTDLAAHCGLDKATAYRMLKCLEEERLVKRRASDRHYLPGPLLFELGLTL